MTSKIYRYPGPASLRLLLSLLLLSATVLLGACSPSAEQPSATTTHTGHAATTAPQANATPRIPDYFAGPAAGKPFPVTLDPKTFSSPSVVKAYQLAKDIPEILAQQPCYCYCDAGFGHKSLLHCHVDDHSAT
jgi:hypothetical protein